MNKRKGFAPILLIILALVISVGGIGIGLAWKTEVFDKILPPNIKEFFGKEITPTNGEQPATDGEEPAGEETQPTTEDATKDWKSYTDSKVGYSVKYPPGWFVYPRPGGVVEGLNPTWYTSADAGSQLQTTGIPDIPSGEAWVAIRLDGDNKKDTETTEIWVRNNISFDDAILKSNVEFGDKIWVELTGPKDRTFYTAKGNRIYVFQLIDLYGTGISAENLMLVELMAETLELL